MGALGPPPSRTAGRNAARGHLGNAMLLL